jgi:TctA family transporter
MQIFKGDFKLIFTRPVALVLLIMSLAFLLSPSQDQYSQGKREKEHLSLISAFKQYSIRV